MPTYTALMFHSDADIKQYGGAPIATLTDTTVKGVYRKMLRRANKIADADFAKTPHLDMSTCIFLFNFHLFIDGRLIKSDWIASKSQKERQNAPK